MCYNINSTEIHSELGNNRKCNTQASFTMINSSNMALIHHLLAIKGTGTKRFVHDSKYVPPFI